MRNKEPDIDQSKCRICDSYELKQRRLEARVKLRNHAICKLKIFGHSVLPVEAKVREDRRRLVASSTNLRLNILQPLSYPCILRS